MSATKRATASRSITRDRTAATSRRTSCHTPAPASRCVSAPRDHRRPVDDQDDQLRRVVARFQQVLALEPVEAHTLGEAIERYRHEHLLVDGLAPNTIEWSERALVTLA